MTNFEIISLCISILAVIISTISLIRTRKIAVEQLELEKITANLSKLQIEGLEKENLKKTKPKFKVNITKLGSSYYFYIHNAGEGNAYDVHFELIDCQDSPLTRELEEKFPYKDMKPGTRVKLVAAFHAQSPRKYEVKLTWKEESGNIESETFHLDW